MANVGVLADVHSNFQALKIALKILEQEDVSKILVCGDIVGYGRMPNQCCALLRSLEDKVVAVAGNHDWAACGKLDYFRSFNPGAIQAMNLTIAELDPSHVQWLSLLPLTTQWENIEISHTVFDTPETFPYSAIPVDSIELLQNIETMQGRLGCVGHSHVPSLLQERAGEIIEIPSPNGPYQLHQYPTIFNPGSVGCPRSDKQLGTLVVYDQEEDSICFHSFRL